MASQFFLRSTFRTKTAAFEYVEAALWPDGPVCPFCGEAAKGRAA